MHELALEQGRELGVRPPWHVGDVTWGLRSHEGREDEWTIRIWKDGDRTVAWSWLKGDRGLLEYDVRRDRLDTVEPIFAPPGRRARAARAARGLPLPDGRARGPGRARCDPPGRLGAVARHRDELRG